MQPCSMKLRTGTKMKQFFEYVKRRSIENPVDNLGWRYIYTMKNETFLFQCFCEKKRHIAPCGDYS